MVLPAVRKRTRSGNRKGPAGVRQDSPGRKPWELRQVRMSALNGRCRPVRHFRVGILSVHVTRARALACPARPFQGRSVGDSPVPRCVFLPRACALGCPARPFQGRLHTLNGPQPGMPANITIGMDRGRLLTVRPLRLIRRSPGTITRSIATVSRVGDSQLSGGGENQFFFRDRIDSCGVNKRRGNIFPWPHFEEVPVMPAAGVPLWPGVFVPTELSQFSVSAMMRNDAPEV